MPGRPARRPPSIRSFPSSTDFGSPPHACWREPTQPGMNQRVLELARLPERLSGFPAQPVRAFEEFWNGIS